MVKRIPVAHVGEIQAGQTKTFRFGVQNGIAFNDGKEVRAFLSFCMHMGGPLELVSGVFRCRWHGAQFDPQSGERLSGQAPEGTRLKPIELVTEGDQIFALLELKDEFA